MIRLIPMRLCVRQLRGVSCNLSRVTLDLAAGIFREVQSKLRSLIRDLERLNFSGRRRQERQNPYVTMRSGSFVDIFLPDKSAQSVPECHP